MLQMDSITAQQIVSSLLAIPAFLPVTFCTGYTAAWLSNIHGFRQRSLVERLFWGVPLSVAISTIASVLIGKALSLDAVVVFFIAAAVLFLATIFIERSQLKRSGRHWIIGWHPFGGRASILVVLWIVIATLSLIDIQSDHQLFMSLTIYDHAPRVNWTQSILRTGIPPVNSLYYYLHPAGMRYYYFWNVLCAAVARMAHLPVRAVFIASCIWGGFILAALLGLYLKHFLPTGDRLRRQFLVASSLSMVSGFSSYVVIWKAICCHTTPVDPQAWHVAQLNSWYDSLLFVPHHISSVACCMLAFLLVWLQRDGSGRERVASVLFSAAALASAFGLSIYVAFGFFLVMVFWALWQTASERVFRHVFLLAISGIGALLFLIPYLQELRSGSSGMYGGSMFSIAVRETFPPQSLLDAPPLRYLVLGYPSATLNLARLIFLVPGIGIELGVFLVVLLVYLVRAFQTATPQRAATPKSTAVSLSPAHRSLLFIATTALLLSSLLRSNVLSINDFGVRCALITQFATLLLASELISLWRSGDPTSATSPTASTRSPQHVPAPKWLRDIFRFAIVLGVITTIYQATVLRFTLPLIFAVAHTHAIADPLDPNLLNLPHNAYISSIGYAHLDKSIPSAAIVQANPAASNPFWPLADELNIDHQTAIAGDKPWCGAELGGDPTGCAAMASAIDSLYIGASAEEARFTCRKYNISYLVSRIYDPAWRNRQSWVWTLNPVVIDPEFRALDCR